MKKHYLGLYIQVFVKEMLCIKTDIPLRIICKHVSLKKKKTVIYKYIVKNVNI